MDILFQEALYRTFTLAMETVQTKNVAMQLGKKITHKNNILKMHFISDQIIALRIS